MNSGMLAFYLPEAAAKYLYEQVAPSLGVLGIPTVPPEDYHMTLVYLGDEVEPSKINDIASVSFYREITGSVQGIGRFETPEGSVIYASFDAPQLPGFRQALFETMTLAGYGQEQTHGFTPHITLAYVDKDAPMPDIHIAPFNITFPRLTVAVGDNRVELEAPLMPEAILQKSWEDENGDLHVPLIALPFHGPVELQGKDLDGDFFDKSTDTGPLTEAIATFNHAHEPELFGELSGKYLGVAYRKDMTEEGWLYDLVVDRSNKYKALVKRIVDANLVKASTTPFQEPARRSRRDSGHYKDWWITEVTLTPSASNPNAVVLIQKSLKELVMPEDNGSNPEQVPVQETPDLAAEIEKAFTGETTAPAEGSTNLADVIVALQKSIANLESKLSAKIDAVDKKVSDTQLALPVLAKQMAAHVSKSLSAQVVDEVSKSPAEKAADLVLRNNAPIRTVSNEFPVGTPGNW